MKIYDFHIHQNGNDVPPEKLIEQMEAAGVYGGSIFSVAPSPIGKATQVGTANTLKERLDSILDYTKDYKDRLYPILWVHPDEPDTMDGIQEAVERGITGFKCICNNFYIYEDKAMKMCEAIAKAGKPIAFHTGILWDKNVSGQYNRPLNWEYLMEIPNIKFSLAHCSWPWINECFAVYTKYLSLANNPEFTPQMFLDLTPGTPMSWRDELIQKIVNSGFDVFHHMLYGTDCNTGNYATAWAKKWIDTDGGLYDKYGVSKENQQLIFRDNFLRFWNISGEVYKYTPVKSDGT